MKHTVTIDLPKYQYDRVNKLLDIESLSEMTDEQLRSARANTDQHVGIFIAEFDDGSILNYDLCSGQENYYDDVVWTSPDGKCDVFLECTFDLDDIEFDVGGETYIVKLNVIDR